MDLYPLSRVKDELSSFVRRAEAGETVRIAVNGRPAARLVPDSHGPESDGGWTLVSDAVASYLPYPFFAPEVEEQRRGYGPPDVHMNEYIDEAALRPGLAALLSAWEPAPERGRDRAILWLHLLDGAAVIAVPRGDWRSYGTFAFFHTAGLDQPITQLSSWADHELSWETGDSTAFLTAHTRAVARGSKQLGLL